MQLRRGAVQCNNRPQLQPGAEKREGRRSQEKRVWAIPTKWNPPFASDSIPMGRKEKRRRKRRRELWTTFASCDTRRRIKEINNRWKQPKRIRAGERTKTMKISK
jgi:hypothetical protein